MTTLSLRSSLVLSIHPRLARSLPPPEVKARLKERLLYCHIFVRRWLPSDTML